MLIVSFSSIAQKQNLLEEYIDSKFNKNGNDVVIELFKQRIKEKIAINSANVSLGYIYLLEEKYDLSEKYYRANLILNPKSGITHFQLGRLYSRKKDFKKALIFLDKAVTLEPENADLYAHRAIFKYTKLDDKIGTENDFTKAVELDPKNASIYLSRAQYRISDNLLLLALIDFNKAIELDPKNYQAYLFRSEIFYNQQRPKEAIKDINSAISIDDKKESAYTARGSLYASLGEFSKANEDFDKSIEIYPNGYYVYYMRSKIKYQAEDMNGYCDDLNKSLSLINQYEQKSPYKSIIENSISSICDNSKSSYYFQRGIAHYNMREYEKSIAIYSKGLEKFPKNSMTLSFRGNSYFEVNQFEKAIADYDLSNLNVDNLKVDMLDNRNYANKSEEEFEKYVNGTLATNHLMSSKSKFALEKYQEALLEIEKGIKIAPDIPEFGLENYHNVRGLILMALGENEKAIADFDKCLQIKIYVPIALINRAIAKINLKTQVKYRSSFISMNSPTTMYFGRWDLPAQSKTEYSKPNLLSALQDCNQAIKEDSEIGYAYYVRGAIKKLLEKEDYCKDLKRAKSLDYQFDESILENCR